MNSLVEGSDAIVFVIYVWSIELSYQSFHCSTLTPTPMLPLCIADIFLSLTLVWPCFFFQLFVSNDLWYVLIFLIKISYCRTLLQVATQVSIIHCTSNAWEMYVLLLFMYCTSNSVLFFLYILVHSWNLLFVFVLCSTKKLRIWKGDWQCHCKL